MQKNQRNCFTKCKKEQLSDTFWYVNSITKKTQGVLNEVENERSAHLVAVVKNREIEEIKHVLAASPSIIAFSRVQEALEKLPQLDFLGEVHMIGRLQKNKVKKAIEVFDCIESVDSLSLAKKIHIEAERKEKKMPILLQVNVSADPDKTGFSPDELEEILPEINTFSALEIQGLMTIGFRTVNENTTRKTFQLLRKLSGKLLAEKKLPAGGTELSMGMSGDYKIALEEGATLVRVGNGLFNEM